MIVSYLGPCSALRCEEMAASRVQVGMGDDVTLIVAVCDVHLSAVKDAMEDLLRVPAVTG